jgi:hypothetical protein
MKPIIQFPMGTSMDSNIIVIQGQGYRVKSSVPGSRYQD